MPWGTCVEAEMCCTVCCTTPMYTLAACLVHIMFLPQPGTVCPTFGPQHGPLVAQQSSVLDTFNGAICASGKPGMYGLLQGD